MYRTDMLEMPVTVKSLIDWQQIINFNIAIKCLAGFKLLYRFLVYL